MSLTASMWTGVSGMLAHGDKMNVIGNNIANVNTIGFKSQRMDFADLMYVSSYNGSGLNQVGQGVTPQTIITSFSQGPYESTTNPTDLAISGSGFFQVSPTGSDQMFYTRAGNFTFDKDGYLVDPNGYALQGWEIDNRGGVTRASGGLSGNATESTSAVLGTGSPTDIKLDAWTIQPFGTSEITISSNLSQEAEDKSSVPSSPFTSLFHIWDGTQPPANDDAPPLPQEAYSYQDTIDVYDEAGVKHTLTVYYDKVDSNDFTGGEGDMWEYIVTMDPAEDMRQYAEVDPITDEVTIVDMSSTKNAGLLAAGTITFSSSGQALNQSCYTLLGDSSPSTDPTDYVEVFDEASGTFKTIPAVDPESSASWQSAGVSANGYPIISPNFTGVIDAQTSGSDKGAQYGIELSFGMKVSNIDSPWNPANGSLADLEVEPYTYNPGYNSLDPTKGPEFYLNNLTYDPAASKPTHTALDLAEDDWDKAGFTVDDGTGANMPYTFTNYINDLANGTVKTITGSTATPGDATAAQAELAGLTNVTALATLPVDDNAFKFQLKAGTSELEKLAYLYNTASSVADVDASIFTEATPVSATAVSEMNDPKILDNAMQSQNGASANYSRSQNGYGFGNLSSYYVDENGVLAGVYSNGITQQLFQIVMYDFTSPQNLYREGGNLYSQTLASGDPKSGPAGVAGLGTITSNAIEQSNVDLATEFVLMITTQRGYQGNSKVVTTVDTMLESVINLKR